MLRQVFDYARSLITLKSQTEKNTADIKELFQDVRELASAVQRLSFELDRLREKEGDEREKLYLRLELALTKFERRLPPGGADDSGRYLTE